MPVSWPGDCLLGFSSGLLDAPVQLDSHVEPLHFRTDESGRIVVEVHQVVRDLSGTVIADDRVEHIFLIQGGLSGAWRAENCRRVGIN